MYGKQAGYSSAFERKPRLTPDHIASHEGDHFYSNENEQVPSATAEIARVNAHYAAQGHRSLNVLLRTSAQQALFIYLFNIKLVQQYTRKEKENKTKKNNKRKHTHTEITIKPE